MRHGLRQILLFLYNKEKFVLFQFLWCQRRRLCNYFRREPQAPANSWICTCCIRCSQKGRGFSNRIKHLDHNLQSDLTPFRQKTLLCTSTMLSSLLYSHKVQNVYGWLSFLIKSLQPFSVVQKTSSEIISVMMLYLSIHSKSILGASLYGSNTKYRHHYQKNWQKY